MAKRLQLRRGTAAENNVFTGANGELTYDTEKKQLRVHDGSTIGGKVVDDTARNVTLQVSNATETVAGKAKIATTAIAQAGTDDTDFLTAKKLRDALNASGNAPIGVFRSYVAFGYVSSAIVIYSSLNVSSVIRNSAGVYTINFTNSLPNSNYGVLATCASTSNNDMTRTVGVSYSGSYPTLKTTSQLMVVHGFANTPSLEDSRFITVGIL